MSIILEEIFNEKIALPFLCWFLSYYMCIKEYIVDFLLYLGSIFDNSV